MEGGGKEVASSAKGEGREPREVSESCQRPVVWRGTLNVVMQL